MITSGLQRPLVFFFTDSLYTLHSRRHTFRTRLSEAGVSDDLAKWLGGWTEDTTAARYDHAERIAELRAAVERAK